MKNVKTLILTNAHEDDEGLSRIYSCVYSWFILEGCDNPYLYLLASDINFVNSLSSFTSRLYDLCHVNSPMCFSGTARYIEGCHLLANFKNNLQPFVPLSDLSMWFCL